MPGDSEYQYQVAVILENLGRIEEARKAAEQIRSSSNDSKIADKAGDLIAQMSQPHPSASPATVSSPAPATPTDRQVHLARKTEPDSKPVEPLPSKAHEAAAPVPSSSPAAASNPTPSEARVYSMVGTITEVSCTDTPQIQITLKAQTIVMHLHAENTAQLMIKPSSAISSAKTSACPGLRGRNARVSYLLVPDKKWDGEIQAVELRD